MSGAKTGVITILCIAEADDVSWNDSHLHQGMHQRPTALHLF